MAKPVIATVGQLDLGGSCAKWAKGFRDSGMSEILKISAIFGFYSDFLNFSLLFRFFRFFGYFSGFMLFFLPTAVGSVLDPACSGECARRRP